MSSIVTDQGIVHYETFGRGKPVILLHGWIGSWGLWHDTMARLGRHYRCYALDFWGFGESSDKRRETYHVDDFTNLVAQFMNQLGIVRAPLVGHSMGGTVSLKVALTYPELISKVAIIGSPIVGWSLSPFLILAGYRPIAWTVYNMPQVLRLGIRTFSGLISSNKGYYAMQERDLSRTNLESFLNSIASLRQTDLRGELHQLNIPVMGLFGDKDVIVHPNQNRALASSLPHAEVHMLAGSGHFPMLDEPDTFISYIERFLAAPANDHP